MATRQNSSSGKPKSPRIQVVLPENLCDELSCLAEKESRTVSNMAKVLIQEGLQRFKATESFSNAKHLSEESTEQFISSLEAQQIRRLRGAPRRFKLYKP
ncbi:ribbon-helix-helix domain-containing protein [Prochlorococcus marinus]|uniref:CopG-like ribbon-helix-helix domain-containing protein n=1 Tax=Prochlorococcus marinus (strain MIT 9211) TaxID=93059 RepID=A9B9H2_PROM4|nr:hypothetical protein [Prochlorococcus marinus]ABX08027.1 Conserved hypothetical protein [Prochlorococcus marinus str. MIT 9211]